MNKRHIIYTIIIVLLYSCVGVKPRSTGKVSKYIEDFYLGDGNMQYFVKPIDYEDANYKITKLDATFRRIDKKTDSVTVNFNIYLKNDDKVSNIEIKEGLSTYETDKISTFFTKRDDDLINHRLSIKLPYEFYLKNLLNGTHSITITSEKDSNKISPSKRSKKKLPIIKEKIYNLL
ncbi:hypothetical protein [Winogradskyella marincola]|uniref:Lipoprotein n=1 Tax=Winogradskyella marincola TaxID=3037795 RepID=A0ABT6G596_9FLAO|nr:hypothetical protein [Winogradskyella sp. YYF002]MDG4717077.1 hypothetical protein [Winogradskyella sp. YYF002]